MTAKTKAKPTDLVQHSAFIAAAKAAGAVTNEQRWEARLKDVAKPPAKPVKKGK